MSRIQIRDKSFVVSISAEKIQTRILEMAAEISRDYEDKKPIFVCILNGAFIFAADLFRALSIECEITFLKLSSYSGTQSTGVVSKISEIKVNLKDRHVVILEDIVDTGETAVYIVEEMKRHQAADVRFASLLIKPKALQHTVRPDYVGFEVPNDFLVGYGLDYDGLGRNLPDIFVLDK